MISGVKKFLQNKCHLAAKFGTRLRSLSCDRSSSYGWMVSCRVVDPYSFFTDPDPDPVDPDGGQYGSGYGSGSGSNPDPGL